MTDKEKFRKEVEKLNAKLLRGACSSQITMETMCKEEAYNEVLAILDTMQEEPASIWHDKGEEPNINSIIIYKCNGCTPDIGRFIGVVGIEGHFSWEIFKYPQSIIINNIEKWAYIDVLLKL